MNNSNVIKYLSSYFKVLVKDEQDNLNMRLPNYINYGYSMQNITIKNIPFIILKAKSKEFRASNLKKVIQSVNTESGSYAVFEFEFLSSIQRQALIKNNIPFVIPFSHLYIPQLGLSFIERQKSIRHPQIKLSSEGQFLLFYLLYDQKQQYMRGQFIIDLHINKMFLSRGINNLMDLDVITYNQEGPISFYELNDSKINIWNKMYNNFVNPIIKRIHISKLRYSSLKSNLIMSGTLALSKNSLLAETEKVFAVDNKLFQSLDLPKINIYEGEINTVEIELWKSKIPIYEDSINPLAIYFSIAENSSERVFSEFDEMASRILGGNIKW